MKKRKRKLKPMGDIMLKLEKCLQHMTNPKGHDLQKYEVLALVNGWLDVHSPHSQEEYEDGSKPAFYYGPRK